MAEKAQYDYDGDGDIDKKDNKKAKKDLNDDGVIDDSERQAWKDGGRGQGGGGGDGKGDGKDDEPKGEFDDLTFDELIAKFGYSLGVIQQFPELRKLFEQIGDMIADGTWPDDMDAAQVKFNAMIAETEFGKRTTSEIEADLTRYGLGREDFGKNIKNLIDEINDTLSLMIGKRLSREDARTIALKLVYEDSAFLRGSFSQDRIREEVTKYIRVTDQEPQAPGQPGGVTELGGQLGDVQDDLMRWFAKNGITVTANRMTKILRDLSDGSTTVESVKQNFRDGWMTRNYSSYGDLFAQGMDLADIAMDFQTRAANLLERDPESFKIDDPIIQRALQHQVDGKPAQMTFTDFDRMVRSDPEWDKTTNAMSVYNDVGEAILRSFGFRG